LSETSQLDIVEDEDEDVVEGEEVLGNGNQGEESV
jgi:hypothetical protein